MVVRRSNRGRACAAGFSLVEIVTVLAIAGLIVGILMTGSTAMMRAISSDDVEQAALAGIAAARHEAVLKGQTLTLTYDEKTRGLSWEAGQTTLAGEDGIQLLPPVSTGSVLLGGRLVETPLTRVRFYADGTCDPFRLAVNRKGAGNAPSRAVTIDPWTCTALADLTKEKR
jgi:type II secretory pathway pseudopilin PulG